MFVLMIWSFKDDPEIEEPRLFGPFETQEAAESAAEGNYDVDHETYRTFRLEAARQ